MNRMSKTNGDSTVRYLTKSNTKGLIYALGRNGTCQQYNPVEGVWAMVRINGCLEDHS